MSDERITFEEGNTDPRLVAHRERRARALSRDVVAERMSRRGWVRWWWWVVALAYGFALGVVVGVILG